MSEASAAAPAIPLGPFVARTRIAYFTMEIGLRPEMHTYSGGLGMLAGDTARSAADMEMPVAFVTLLSSEGYLRQEIDRSGWQVDHPDPWSPADWARPTGAKTVVEIEGREVWVRPWFYPLKGGTGAYLPVILLDTDLPENDPPDRTITHRLYGGDAAYRLKQEIVLGIGGVRALQALGFNIDTYHMNEGHAALLAVELLRRTSRTDNGAGGPAYDEGAVRNMCIFTTHTPIEAGHDRFDYGLVERTLGEVIAYDELKRLAGADSLNMTRLALNLSAYVNGVAKRHAVVSERMFPGYRVHAVTNGVHPSSWVAAPLAALYDEHVADWRHEPEMLVRADLIPAEAVWDAHQEAKRALIAEVERIGGVSLSATAPILGFARRMTGYKRPDLLFSDPARLRAIAVERPFQVVVAGKAHPRDEPGKRAIQAIHEHAAALRGAVPVVFLPNYTMAMARRMVAGCDVWLNTPLPPLEASGTSGMKAALNGVLNLSVLDGWWLEGCVEGQTGWAVGADGDGAAHEDDAAHLYRKLAERVLPLYYDDRDGWVTMMREAIAKLGSTFTSHRMVRRYAAEAYIR